MLQSFCKFHSEVSLLLTISLSLGAVNNIFHLAYKKTCQAQHFDMGVALINRWCHDSHSRNAAAKNGHCPYESYTYLIRRCDVRHCLLCSSAACQRRRWRARSHDGRRSSRCTKVSLASPRRCRERRERNGGRSSLSTLPGRSGRIPRC